MVSEGQYNFQDRIVISSSNGAQLTGLCPFHEDRSPSFSCNTDTGLWKCFSGCGSGDFAKFMVMYGKGKNVTKLGEPSQRRNTGNRFDWSGFMHVSTHLYENLAFETNFRVKRFEHPEKGKVFVQEHWTGRQWVSGKCAWDLLPYLARHWISDMSKVVFFVEGEKCADHLHSLRLKATTVPGGASGWHPKYVKHFKGHTIIILPDNDDIGHEFAGEVFRDMVRAKIDVKTVSLPGLGDGEDVVDWLTKGHSRDDLIAVSLSIPE